MPEERETALSATSVDGLHFTLDVPVERLALGVGSYVVVGDGGSERLAYTTEVALDPSDRRLARVEGRMLDGRGEPFGDAAARPAGPDDVRQWLEAARPARAALEVGSLTYADGVPLALDAGAFDRHTFLCGQSGSGKTYALGTILERLLAETTLRVVVLDPNSDFVRLHELRDDAGHESRARYARRRRARSTSAGRAPTRSAACDVRFRDFDADGAGGPAATRPDRRPRGVRGCSMPSSALDDQGVATVAATIEALLKAERPLRSLALRARNLGVDRWQVWAGARQPGSRSTRSAARRPAVRRRRPRLARDPRGAGARGRGASSRRSGAAARAREPVLIVIDEAHNVCPAAPEDPLTALATEHAVRIAGEGRKFGLVPARRDPAAAEGARERRLPVRQPRPDADELPRRPRRTVARRLLVRPAGAARTRRRRSARARRSWRASSSASPTLGRFGPRCAEEGGSDVPADWAAARV